MLMRVESFFTGTFGLHLQHILYILENFILYFVEVLDLTMFLHYQHLIFIK